MNKNVTREMEMGLVAAEQDERKKNLNDQLQLLLADFSFAACSTIMQQLGIRRYNPMCRRDEAPSAIELRDLGERLLREVAATVGEEAEIHSGGLSAYRVGDSYFRLTFELERVSTNDIIVPETTWNAY